MKTDNIITKQWLTTDIIITKQWMKTQTNMFGPIWYIYITCFRKFSKLILSNIAQKMECNQFSITIRKEKSRKSFKCQNLDQLYTYVGGQIQFKFCKFEQSQSKCKITDQFKKTKLLILKTEYALSSVTFDTGMGC